MLENDYLDNLHSTKNQPQQTVKQLFDMTKKLVKDQKEIQAQTYLFSDSVLYMDRISNNPTSASQEKIDWFINSSQCREMDRIDGEPTEFEWKIFPEFTALQILAEIQNMMNEIECEPGQFPGRIIFMSMYNDIVR